MMKRAGGSFIRGLSFDLLDWFALDGEINDSDVAASGQFRILMVHE